MSGCSFRLGPPARLGLVLGLVVATSGCGATGLAWVAESERPAESMESDSRAGRSSFQEPDSSVIPAAVEQEFKGARPRLSHTVTLGEIAEAPRRAPGAPSVTAGVSVTINNYQIGGSSGAGLGYSTFAYGRSQPALFAGGGAVGPLPSSAAGPQAGQNWPAIADHGSSFPLRSSPASPWARTR